MLAGILLKLGRYGLLLFAPRLVAGVLYLYLSLRVWGGIFCRLLCLRQADLKGLIAYSSVVHIGVVTVGVISGTELGYVCALLMMIAHGLCSPMLFAVAFVVYNSSHRRVINNNKGSLATPALTFFVFLSVAINIGVPPRINLWREVYIFIRLIRGITTSLFCLGAAAAFGVIYNLYLYISLSQSKEFDYLKIDCVYWPFFSSGVLGFLLFPGLRGFGAWEARTKAISITFTLFRLSPYLPEVTGDMYKK